MVQVARIYRMGRNPELIQEPARESIQEPKKNLHFLLQIWVSRRKESLPRVGCQFQAEPPSVSFKFQFYNAKYITSRSAVQSIDCAEKAIECVLT